MSSNTRPLPRLATQPRGVLPVDQTDQKSDSKLLIVDFPQHGKAPAADDTAERLAKVQKHLDTVARLLAAERLANSELARELAVHRLANGELRDQDEGQKAQIRHLTQGNAKLLGAQQLLQESQSNLEQDLADERSDHGYTKKLSVIAVLLWIAAGTFLYVVYHRPLVTTLTKVSQVAQKTGEDLRRVDMDVSRLNIENGKLRSENNIANAENGRLSNEVFHLTHPNTMNLRAKRQLRSWSGKPGIERRLKKASKKASR